MPKHMAVLDRWRQKVAFAGPDDCWLWTASKDPDGYGRFQVPTPNGQRHIRAHVWSYQHFKGPVPPGQVVMHSCDVRHCVNPAHLSLGTPRDNNDDKIAKGRQAKVWGLPLTRSRQTHCKRGHPLCGENLKIVNGYRRCVACNNLRARLAYRRKHGLPGEGTPR